MRIVITGANRGIGRGLYDHYATLGQDVTGTTRGAAPGPGRWLSLDVTDPQSCAALGRDLGGEALDLLICNAGVYLDKGHTLDTGYDPGLWAQTFAANVTGVFLTIQALLPQLQRSETPRIAIISSRMGSQTLAGGGSYIYRASKAAVLNLGRNLAVDLRDRGVAVGIYHPGWVQTNMGGQSAAITVDDAVHGLTARFAALDLGRTGCFEAWDGQALEM